MSTVIVVCGGTSGEREVSLRSGTAVASALEAAGYNVKVVDSSASNEALLAGDVVFPLLHGVGGEDGTFQARLEKLGIAFVGSGSEASRLCMQKDLYRLHLEKAGFPVPEGALIDANEYSSHPLRKYPYVLKPHDGGSSLDTFIVRTAEGADETAINAAFDKHQTMLIERLIEGIEITVGVLGEKSLPIIEIIPPLGGEFDYTNKYNGASQELCPPQHIKQADQIHAQELALEVHQSIGCRDFSRTDMFIRPNGEVVILETNTIPGMTAQSLYPKMGATAGFTFPELTARLVELALTH